jgi:hypothetical protein
MRQTIYKLTYTVRELRIHVFKLGAFIVSRQRKATDRNKISGFSIRLFSVKVFQNTVNIHLESRSKRYHMIYCSTFYMSSTEKIRAQAKTNFVA